MVNICQASHLPDQPFEFDLPYFHESPRNFPPDFLLIPNLFTKCHKCSSLQPCSPISTLESTFALAKASPPTAKPLTATMTWLSPSKVDRMSHTSEQSGHWPRVNNEGPGEPLFGNFWALSLKHPIWGCPILICTHIGVKWDHHR